MSFLSKRRRSQRSFVRGPRSEEFTVRRVEPSNEIQIRNETLPAGSSIPPNSNAADFALDDSCVSSHLRFLAWVAYTRKFTDEPITQEERRTCPLLWCRAVFEDQEAMLQHVWDCEHLAKGLYWCFHCQKPERVGSFQCRRCQGTPSKTDRIATVAKRIFSKLGSKHHKTPKVPQPQPEPDMTVAKYPEISETLENHPDFPTMYDAGPGGDYSSQELSRTAGTSRSASDWAARELPDTQICEMIGSECPLELSNGAEESWLPQSYQVNQDSWFTPDIPLASNNSNPEKPWSLDLLPPLNTQLPRPNQGRVSSQDYNDDWTDEPMSATLVSPLDVDGRDDRFASLFQEISPTDTELSGISFLTDSGYTSATVSSTWSSSSMANFELHPGFNEPRGKKRYRDEIEQTHSINAIVSRNSSTRSTNSVSPEETEVVEAENTHSPSRCPSTKKPKIVSPYWESASTLVQSFILRGT
ncbi:hypothetical protein HYALB_00004916 [Hymenoscyphus albidus]|uniref:Uncharacterized protein n=1 Tax=Hymenoscyphus albidus TaxID=595503 RepID=A0A9N9LG99_9HELO|nr:hypothetical protein HYALB_00004916 [Hymenoscyphus albidus]